MTSCNIKLCLHLIKIGVFGILQNFSIIIFKYKFPWKIDLINISMIDGYLIFTPLSPQHEHLTVASVEVAMDHHNE